MNAMTEVHTNIPALAMEEGDLMSVLRSSLYPGAKDESIKMVIGWCRAQQKDPMKRPVHIVPMSVKKPGTRDEYEWRDVLMPGIGDYRTDASRTGRYAGIDEAEFGPDVTRSLGGVEITFPDWCEVTVYRIVDGVRCPFSSGKVRWLETYATAKKDTLAPNAMWRKRPYGQIEKCAEAMALRRAFPEVGAQPSAEEMEGRVIEPEAIEPDAQGITMPRAKSAQPSEPEPKPAEQPKVVDAEVIEKPAPQSRGQQGEPSAKPAPDGMKKMIRARLESAGKTDADLLAHFQFAEPAEQFWTALTLDRGNAALKWIANPS